MAKKDDFDFDSESGGKVKFDLVGFFKNLTKQQKGIILIAAVAVVLVIAIVITCIALGANSNNGGNNDDNPGNDEGAVMGEENITGIFISSAPYKNYYYVGDLPDYEGLVVGVQGTNITERYLDYEEYMDVLTITGFDSTNPADTQTITVEYKGFKDTFNIEILEIPLVAPTLQSIRLDPAPKDTCKLGKSPSIKDARIVCTYSDGSEQSIKLAYNHLYNYEDALMAAQIGDTITITVRYSENGVMAETSFTVTITE